MDSQVSEKNHSTVKKQPDGWVERVFEKSLWSTRFFVLLAVIFGLVGALVLFLIASIDIFNVAKTTIQTYTSGSHPENFHSFVLASIIGAIDLYLIAVVLLIFSFGLYELFISQVEVARESESARVLEIHSLDALKDKISKVIIMVLIVSFFQKVLSLSYQTPLDMLYLAGSIFALSTGLYFLHRHKH